MSANNQIIKIKPSILIWARESLGLTVAEVAAKFDKDRDVVQQWENGKTSPTLAQLEKLAYSIYKRPLAVFFLPEPPKESTPKEDFRTLPQQEIRNLSPELRLIIRKAKHHQLVLKQINDGKNSATKPIHSEFQFKLTNNPIKSADKVRGYLGINKRLHQEFKNSEEAFKYYRNIIELNGVFVFQYPLTGARGFSLMDKEFPVIVLNSGDTFNGKLFTLFHELCHILFNTGGVFRDINTEQLKQRPDKIEVFCNQFASEVLLPGDELLREPAILENKGKEWSDAALESVANIYKVSKEVILRKLLDLGKTTKAFYLNARNRWNKKYNDEQDMKIKQEGGPAYHVANLSHLGKNFVTQVLNNYHSGKLSETQVADFLNIKLNRIKEYEAKIA